MTSAGTTTPSGSSPDSVPAWLSATATPATAPTPTTAPTTALMPTSAVIRAATARGDWPRAQNRADSRSRVTTSSCTICERPTSALPTINVNATGSIARRPAMRPASSSSVRLSRWSTSMDSYSGTVPRHDCMTPAHADVTAVRLVAVMLSIDSGTIVQIARGTEPMRAHADSSITKGPSGSPPPEATRASPYQRGSSGSTARQVPDTVNGRSLMISSSPTRRPSSSASSA